MTTLKLITLAGTSVLALMSALPATAQSAHEATSTQSTGNTTSQPAEPTAEQTGDILVTARKREERLSDIPETIAVLGANTLESRNVRDLNGIQTLVPSFSFNRLQDPSIVYVSVRGINSVRNSENPVALVIDGVQTNDASQINQQFFDVERIEFLKGPQGSLYGRNAIGGAINIVTKRPTNELSGRFNATYQNGNDRGFTGSLSGAIIPDTLLFRVGASFKDYDGLIINETTNKPADFLSDKSFFAKLYYTPSDRLKFELRGAHAESKGGSYYFKKVGIGFINQEERFPVIETPQGLSKTFSDDASLKTELGLGFATLTSVTAYNRNGNQLDGDLLISPERDGQLGEFYVNRAFNEDLRLTSNGTGRFRWVAGAYYIHKKQFTINSVYLGPALVPGTVLPRDLGIEFGKFYDFPNPPGTLLASRKNFDFTNEAYAFYGQADYDLTSRLTLTLGLRYDNERRSSLNLGTLAFNFATGKTERVPAAQDVARFRSNTYDALQPKISLSYKFPDDSLLYATVSSGFRSGGFNRTTRAAFEDYPSEKLWNYEIGEKTSFFGGKVRFDTAAFLMIDKNRPDFFFFVGDATQNIFPIAKTRIYGVELNLSARPFRGLTINAGMSALDTKILDINTVNIDPNPARSGLGKHVSYVYHQQYSLSAEYEHSLTSAVDLLLGTDFSLKAQNYFWYSNDGFEQEPVPLLNARVALRRGGAEFKVFTENLLNFSYVTAHDPSFAFGFDQDDAFPAPPRRYGVALSYRF